MNRFDVCWVNLDPTRGREIKKTRPCVIISPDSMNSRLGAVIVAPLTTNLTDDWPFRVDVKVAGKPSRVALDHIRSVSKERLGKKAGTLTKPERAALLELLQELFAA